MVLSLLIVINWKYNCFDLPSFSFVSHRMYIMEMALKKFLIRENRLVLLGLHEILHFDVLALRLVKVSKFLFLISIFCHFTVF